MDDLSKLSILGIECLKEHVDYGEYEDDEICLIFANKSSSTFTDNKYVKSIEKGAPSPSLFVYTLPNICTGEIAICNKWYGRSCFYVADQLSDLPLIDLVSVESAKGARAFVIGWVEKNDDDELGIFIFIKGELNKEQAAYILSIINAK
jgi:hypothetical protein